MASQPPRGITFVAHDVGGIGGTEQQVLRVALAAAEQGFEVSVVSRTLVLPDGDALSWIRVPTPRRPGFIAYLAFAFVSFALVQARRRRDLIHVTNAWSLLRADIRTVHFCHRAFEATRPPSRASRDNIAFRANAVVSRWTNLIMERLCYRPKYSARIVAVSDGLAGEIEHHYPSMRGRLKVIPNGVDTVRYGNPPDAAAQLPKSSFCALFVGGDWKRKGLDAVIEAIAQAPNWSLTVVGSGDVVAMNEYAKTAGVDGRVHFVGVKSDPRRFYWEADAFVFPSAYETFGMAVLEAMAAGLPVIAARTNGIVDFIDDGRSGYLVPIDPDEIARKLILLEDNGARLKMGGAAQATASRYDWTRVCSEYAAYFASVSDDG